jgi:hypothetical protein
MILRSTFATLIAASALASASGAEEIRCAPLGDEEQATTPEAALRRDCRDEDGRAVEVHRDPFGRLSVRDADGGLVQGTDDSFGATTFRLAPPPGPRVVGSAPDGLGGVVLRDGARPPVAVPTDRLGNSVINDGGPVRRCWTDPVGVTTCD